MNVTNGGRRSISGRPRPPDGGVSLEDEKVFAFGGVET